MGELPPSLVERVRAICRALPGSVEETAWTGLRWAVAKKAYANLVQVAGGWPPAYARAVGQDGPCTVLTVRVEDADAAALVAAGSPYFRPPWGIRWRPTIIGVTLEPGCDWAQVAELITESHRLLAPTGWGSTAPR